MQAAPDAVIAVLPYAMPVLEERLQIQEVCSLHGFWAMFTLSLLLWTAWIMH